LSAGLLGLATQAQAGGPYAVRRDLVAFMETLTGAAEAEPPLKLP
jgi:hypothetical protein